MSTEEDNATADESHLKSITRNILSNDKTEGSNAFDNINMDADVLSALKPDGVSKDDSHETIEVVDPALPSFCTQSSTEGRNSKRNTSYTFLLVILAFAVPEITNMT